MKRSDFLKAMVVILLWPTVVLGKKCITSCDQCLRDYECCKTMPRDVWPKELEIMKRLLRDGEELHLKYRKGGDHYTVLPPCPFQLESGKCRIYSWRQHMCRIYYCDDFCLSKEEKKKIKLKVLKEWNFGKKVDLDSLPDPRSLMPR